VHRCSTSKQSVHEWPGQRGGCGECVLVQYSMRKQAGRSERTCRAVRHRDDQGLKDPRVGPRPEHEWICVEATGRVIVISRRSLRLFWL